MPKPLFIAGAVVAFLYGTVVGSFLNVCIYRLPRGESVLYPPSHCPHCKARLRPLDLVPLLSFLALGRRCRACGKPISWRYFIIELLTGVLFFACWWSLAARFPAVLASFAGILLVVLLWAWTGTMLVTFVIDLETTYVIEPVTWTAMAAGVLFELIRAWNSGQPVAFTLGGLHVPFVPAAVPGMVIGFLVFVLMDLFGRLVFRKPGMGLGDAYIGAAIGAMLGPGLAMLAFGIAVTLGAVVGVGLILLGAFSGERGAAESTSEGALTETDEDELPRGRYMPFGPFLTASAVAVAMAPEWFGAKAEALFRWWFFKNPLM